MGKYKVGVVGGVRGMHVAAYFKYFDCDLVALCEIDKERAEAVRPQLAENAVIYDNFESFIEHDLDIVILGNDFHEHAPYAIECFKRGIHVYSECISNGTMAEGVALIRAYEKYKKENGVIYMLAENYMHMLHNIEMKRLADAGKLGKILFAECEYNHAANPNDISFRKRLSFNLKHWRNYLPRSYYLTHSLGPIMWITGATPKKVTALPVYHPVPRTRPSLSHIGDFLSVMTTLNDDGSAFRFFAHSGLAGESYWTRVSGTKGQVENTRCMKDMSKIALHYNPWDKPEDAEAPDLYYTPEWNDPDEDKIKGAGHWGGDYLTPRLFMACIEKNVEPEHPFDIHSAVNMSSVAILAHRSTLNGGMPYDIPDFHNEEDRVKYENDWQSPFYCSDGREPNIPCCSVPDYAPTEKQINDYFESIGIEKK
ncbi:MAG: Gfo/Idh/MocA family oxidoreductase [Clostridiales bacterium]|nr:Gfo/Idh/MocA family oxidoreductase [Clostridiales bacterium]